MTGTTPPPDWSSPWESSDQFYEHDFDIPENAILRFFEIRIGDDGIGDPIIMMPFYWHSPSKGYHTICTEGNDEIQQLEV